MLTSTSMITAAVLLTLLAIAFGVILGWANRAFHVEVDPKVEAINDALPGANCGGCGFVGCSEYAEAVVQWREEFSDIHLDQLNGTGDYEDETDEP